MRKIGLSCQAMLFQILTAPRRSAAIQLYDRASESHNHPEGSAVAKPNGYVAVPFGTPLAGLGRRATAFRKPCSAFGSRSGEHLRTNLAW